MGGKSAMRIDAHQHFWKFDPVRDAWIMPEMQTIRRDFYPEDLKPILDRHHIHGSVAVQADQSEAETRFLLDLAENNSFIKGVVGWIDLRSPDLEERLGGYAGRTLLKGFRHIVQGETDPAFMNHPDFLRGVKLLHRYGYTYDILIYQHQLPMAIEFVKNCPEQPLVLDHIAKPLIRNGDWRNWALGIRSLASFPSVMCKVSGMVTEANWHHWTPEQFRIYLEVVTEAFGPGRLMYGSDWPVCLLAASYEQQLNILERFFSSLSADEQAAIVGLNAVRFYNL
ncbi:MAG: amidohydrolase family protein [Bacteroidota bacterium]